MIRYLPKTITIDDMEYSIRNDGDFGMVLDVFSALTDPDIDEMYRVRAALEIFYPEIDRIQNQKTAIEEMYKFIDCGAEDDSPKRPKPKLMDWEQDFNLIIAPINRILGADVRGMEYCHWWTFMSAYQEIGECTFSQVVSLRKKRNSGKKLEKWEREYMREHSDIVNLNKKYTAEELAWLNGG